MAIVAVALESTDQATACKGESCQLEKPNLIFLLTDDQDMIVGSLQGMSYTIPMMEQYGVSLPNFFANTPVCSYPTAQYEFDFKYPFEYELFDLSNDEWQMWNLYGLLESHQDEPTKSIIKELQEYLHTQVKCKGQKECVCAPKYCR